MLKLRTNDIITRKTPTFVSQYYTVRDACRVVSNSNKSDDIELETWNRIVRIMRPVKENIYTTLYS